MRAVTGNDSLGYGELTRMIAAENIYNAFVSRAKSDSWTEWAKRNEKAAELLARIERMING